MVSVGLFIKVEAKPDKAAEVETMLKAAVEAVRQEGKAVCWFGLRLGPTTFAVYDAFADEEDRRAHLEANGEALRKAGADLFAAPPTVEHIDVVASLLPEK